MDKRNWLIFFEDASVPCEMFTEEIPARKRMAVLEQSWAVHLFHRVAECELYYHRSPEKRPNLPAEQLRKLDTNTRCSCKGK